MVQKENSFYMKLRTKSVEKHMDCFPEHFWKLRVEGCMREHKSPEYWRVSVSNCGLQIKWNIKIFMCPGVQLCWVAAVYSSPLTQTISYINALCVDIFQTCWLHVWTSSWKTLPWTNFPGIVHNSCVKMAKAISKSFTLKLHLNNVCPNSL